MRIRIYNSLMSAFSEHFLHKTKKHCLILVIKQLLFIFTNIKAQEIDYFEAVFLPNIDESCCFVHEQFLTSRRFMCLLAMSLGTILVLTLISIGRKALTFQRITVTDKKLHLTTTCARKLEDVVFFCLFVVSSCGLSL